VYELLQGSLPAQLLPARGVAGKPRQLSSLLQRVATFNWQVRLAGVLLLLLLLPSIVLISKRRQHMFREAATKTCFMRLAGLLLLLLLLLLPSIVTVDSCDWQREATHVLYEAGTGAGRA
jgi:hypothetical protein